jgi:hypothetical protein
LRKTTALSIMRVLFIIPVVFPMALVLGVPRRAADPGITTRD